MFKNSLDSKPIIDSNGEEIIDLSSPSFSNLYTNSYDVYRVPRDFVMRPDKISKATYNDTAYTEIILKYNGISNPLTIDENDIIIIPNLDDAKDSINSMALQSNNKSKLNSGDQQIRNSYKYIDPTKAPTSNNNSYDKAIQDNSLPPNIADENESQITYRGGKIYFGDVNRIPCDTTQGMAVGEFLQNIIKNK